MTPVCHLYRWGSGSRGGVVAFVVNMALKYQLLSDFFRMSACFGSSQFLSSDVFSVWCIDEQIVMIIFSCWLYVHLLRQSSKNIILPGDFNVAAIDWSVINYGNSKLCAKLLGIMFSLCLEQMFKEATRKTSILDVVFVTKSFAGAFVPTESGISDAKLISFARN